MDTTVDPIDAVRHARVTNLARVTKHRGAFTGLLICLMASGAVMIFCAWFTAGRSKEVNGPVSCGIMVALSLILALFGWYESRIVTDPGKFGFWKGMITAGAISASIALIGAMGTIVYRDQSGGNTLNGIEAMLIVGFLLTIGVVAQIIAIRNLGGFHRHSETAAVEADTGD